jgi:Protein of unknown function (DUF3455)
MNSMREIVCPLFVTMACSQAALAGGDESPPSVPPAIAVPAGHKLESVLHASGVQIYRCQAAAQPATGYVWAFVAPEAALFNRDGTPAGRHYAGPTWEANDGSKAVGTLVAKAAAPDGNSIPWLLLSAAVVQSGTKFGKVAFVQRLHTEGGAAPATGCTSEAANSEARVPYTADYYFYTSDSVPHALESY